MKNKKGLMTGLCAIFIMIVMTACGNQIPDMTEEQNAMVVEYAANVLLQNSGNYQSKLVDTSVPQEETQKEEDAAITDEVIEPTEEEPTEGAGMDSETQTPGEPGELPAETDGIADSEQEAPAMTIAQVLGLSGFEANYTGYRLCDSYPDGEIDQENMFFAMNASNGMKLLIVGIDVTNMMAETATLDTLSIDAKYRIVLNGEHKQNVLVTMLDDDFSALKKEIGAGETISTVVVTEITEESADSLQSVGLEVKCGDNKTIITQ